MACRRTESVRGAGRLGGRWRDGNRDGLRGVYMLCIYLKLSDYEPEVPIWDERGRSGVMVGNVAREHRGSRLRDSIKAASKKAREKYK